MDNTISRQAAIDALWKALYEYEDKTEKQFQESDDLDLCDWMVHRIFVQNMSDIDRQTLLDLSSAERLGTWTTRRTMEHDGETYCDQCGWTWEAMTHGRISVTRTPFCPNCGARMRMTRE